MRGWLPRLLAGAVVGAAAVGSAQATAPYRSFGCAGVDGNGPPPCGPGPGLWSWSSISPWIVVAGAACGALLATGLGVLARRVRARRQSWGEQ